MVEMQPRLILLVFRRWALQGNPTAAKVGDHVKIGCVSIYRPFQTVYGILLVGLA